MNKRVLRTLEYDKIINQLTSLAESSAGKELAKHTRPMSELSDIEAAQSQTSDALTRLYRHGAPSFSRVADMGASFLRLEAGAVLGAGELLRICNLLECAAGAISYNDETMDCLSGLFGQLVPLSPLRREIARCIISEEEISDDASPGLRSVRRSMNSINDRIHEQLNSILNSSRNMLREAIITMRGGRYCLPVRADSRAGFAGMIHDRSATGATLFIEPMSVVKLNNELKELEAKENEEIEKILATLSASAAEDSDAIKNDYKILAELDYIFARGRLARQMKAVRPVFNTDGCIDLKKARHPLIAPGDIVPIDIYCGKDFRHLIITGPNTGGKTVSLKTVGLFTLLGQSGLHIPAMENSKLALFKEVYADIGDEQSIEQSLSTFSSHMTNIVYILKKANSSSLVLFDELCTGTDPEEGAALAISILEDLLRRNVTVFATTHYSELKLYALSKEGVENACCEFNVQTLKPTYKLLIGIPGKSNAFAISGRLGLPRRIIDDAKDRTRKDALNFEDVLGDIEKTRSAIEKQKKEINEAKDDIDKLRKKLQDKNDRIDKAKDKILRRANEEARTILEEAKTLADNSLKKYNEIMQHADGVRELEKERALLREGIDKRDTALAVKASAKAKPRKIVSADNIKPGDSVHVISMGLDGVVLTLPNAKNMVDVQMGMFASSVNIKDLELNEEKPEKQTVSHKVPQGFGLSKARDISPEINLIGKTVDEAITALDKYLDDAYLSHLTRVTVIHGRGTGALRRAVHSHLKNLSYVASYRIGEFGEGDHGVTIVEFKN